MVEVEDEKCKVDIADVEYEAAWQNGIRCLVWTFVEDKTDEHLNDEDVCAKDVR